MYHPFLSLTFFFQLKMGIGLGMRPAHNASRYDVTVVTIAARVPCFSDRMWWLALELVGHCI